MRYTAQKQGSLEWLKLRLGRVTSTTVAALMTKARKSGEISDTAKTEIYRIKAERLLRNEYRNSKFQEYLDRTGVKFNTPAIIWGKYTEDEARNLYKITNCLNDEVVQEVEFVTPDDDKLEPYWGDSPDGLVFDKDHKIIGCIEIKCPLSSTFLKYLDGFDSGLSLKEVEKKYYWQVLNHLFINKAEWCDFILYDPMLKNGYRVVRINRSEVENDITDMVNTITDIINRFFM